MFRWSMLALLVQQGGAGEASSSSESLDTSEKPLEKFCGLDLGQAIEAMVIDCSCCITADVGDYAQQVGALFGSRRSLVDVDGGGKKGQVPVWSLGTHVPEVVCNKGRAMCSCSAKDKTWVEHEPSCKTKLGSCRRESPPREWPTVCAEGSNCPGRDKALGRDQSKGKAHKDDGTDTSPDAAAGTPKKGSNDCTTLPSWYMDTENPKFTTRVSLGSARCEDASPEQCHLFYSKVAGSWHHCEATTSRVKQCPAMAVTEDIIRVNTEELEAWAIKHAYSPGAWPVKILDDGTIEAVKAPTREEFLLHMGNLPKRIDEKYKL